MFLGRVKVFVMLAGIIGAAMLAYSWAEEPKELQEAHEAYKKGNWNKAAELYSPWAEKGYPAAQNNLGELYVRGKGVRRDYSRAMELFYMAAEQGNVYAQTNLGLHYSQGMGVPQDFDEAYKWFLKAARQGNFLAQNALGLFYMRGRSVEKDPVQAYKWFVLSAEQGFDQARDNKEGFAQHLTPEEKQKAKQKVEEFQANIRESP